MTVKSISLPTQNTTNKLQSAADGAWTAIKRVQGRMTEEIRAEDGIKGIEVHGNTVRVLVAAGGPVEEKGIRHAVQEHLTKAGAPNATIEIQQILDAPGTPDRPTGKAGQVATALEAIQKIQARQTADIRVEDGVMSLSFLDNVVNVVVSPTAGSNVAIGKAVLKHLDDAGFKNAKLEFIRPEICGPFIAPTPPPAAKPGTVKAAVETFSADLARIHNRGFENLVIEDAVVGVRIKGSRLHVSIKDDTAYSAAEVKSWVKAEMKTRGITLPVTFTVAADPSGPPVHTMALGENGSFGGGGVTTMAIPENGDFHPPPLDHGHGSTEAVGEEDGGQAFTMAIPENGDYGHGSTEAVGEEDGGQHGGGYIDGRGGSTEAVGEEDGGQAFTMAIPENGDYGHGSTEAIGEEDGGMAHTMAIPENGDFGHGSTEAIGEEDGGMARTMAIPENGDFGGGGPVRTMALSENGDFGGGRVTTMAIPENGDFGGGGTKKS